MAYYASDDIDVRTHVPTPGLIVLRVVGEVDILGAPAIRRCVDDSLPEARSLVLDLTSTTFFGAAGLSVLVHTSAAAHRYGARWAIMCSPVVLRTVQITGLDRDLPVCSSFAEALVLATEPTPVLTQR